MNESNRTSSSMIFTLEEDNEHAPVYEQKQGNLEDSLNAIRNRYRRSEELLASHRQRLASVAGASLDNEPVENAPETALPDTENTAPPADDTDFKLPEIDMPDEGREFSLDDVEQDADNAETHESAENEAEETEAENGDSTENHVPASEATQAEDTPSETDLSDSAEATEPEHHHDNHNDDDDEHEDEEALAKLFKRYQAERDASPIRPIATPSLPLVQNSDEQVRQGQQAYLRYREQEHNQKVAQSSINQDDIGILLQEDWLSAQQALQADAQATRTIRLQPTEIADEVEYRLDDDWVQAEDIDDFPAVTVHVYDLPDLPSTRKVKVLSERELVEQLQDKLRPHLSNAVAGLMHHVLQKKLATLSYELQMMLNEETPRLVEDVLEHNVERIIREIKEQL